MSAPSESHRLSYIRHNRVTHACAERGYRVCRGPGGPLGEVWGPFREGAS
jgi:hypothetical protein